MAAFAPLPCPQSPICIVGDLHGRLDLLQRMLDAIDARPDAGAHRIVFVGDMIDRGPQSAAILNQLSEMSSAAPGHVICLMGNHERMMLDFLDDPARHGPLWLGNGGNETLASFGLAPWTRNAGVSADKRLERLGAALAAAMPSEIAKWLKALPLVWREDGLVATHAGADPSRAIEDQSAQTHLWGHPSFLRQKRYDGLWVAHGHTIMDEGHAQSGRIAVDTGAWRTNRLSAAWLSQDGLEFIEVSTA
ncbi:metallophosphoesterase [Roseovarius arcticus]|uniref:metallophosphoesterase n=1 Tax=Roseovarius arcticus TaxID=2547404 RepID=UPI001110D259|nr:metallophosphoesterase [Roseovarius arcticus]